MQLLTSITGFQGLRIADNINIIQNLNLVSLDGLTGLQRVGIARMFFNGALCYIGTSIPNPSYWQVSSDIYNIIAISYYSILIFLLVLAIVYIMLNTWYPFNMLKYLCFIKTM